jgi:hypothetical protein
MLDVAGDTTAREAAESPRQVARPRPRWGLELALVAVLYVAYDTTRGLRQGSLSSAQRTGEQLLHWEQALHIAPEHALNQFLWHTTAAAVVASYIYATLHFVVTPAVLIWLYRSHPGAYRSARTTVALGTGIALIAFWLLPTAPPRLLPGSDIHDILASVHQWGWWGGDGSAPRGLGSLTNQLAAMPSLHVGWALWSGWLIARHARHRCVRVLGAAYPVVITLVVMGTGNHYLLDALAGASVIALSAGIVHLLAVAGARWRTPAQHPAQSAGAPLPLVIDLRDQPSGGTARRIAGHRPARQRACSGKSQGVPSDMA